MSLGPSHFTLPEIDALLYGLLVAVQDEDRAFSQNASAALGKVIAALPDEATEMPPGPPGATPHSAAIHRAIAAELKLQLRYTDKDGKSSARIVWPFLLSVDDAAGYLVAWCELRNDFRQFRLDRMVAAEVLGERYATPRRVLRAEYRAQETLEGRF